MSITRIIYITKSNICFGVAMSNIRFTIKLSFHRLLCSFRSKV
nr:MAG TPA: hypothetical protein [Caudoviricetes sp.]